MSENVKTSYKMYSAWNYQQEIKDLNAASEQGWQLVKGGCFHSKFVKNPEIRFRYQLDYRKIEDMGRYIETFREQGWEYINSTFNGWHYFRKLYDPSLPEEAYEIFTDQESLQEMKNRWVRLAFIVGILALAMAAVNMIFLIPQPNLPRGIQTLMLLIESAVLLRGGLIMRKESSAGGNKGSFFMVFLAVVLIGALISITLTLLRPSFTSDQRAESVDSPVINNRWTEFEIKYPDFYYLDLEIEAEQPITFAVVDENGRFVYEVTEADFEEENIRLLLPRGKYWFSMSSNSGFHVRCDFG